MIRQLTFLSSGTRSLHTTRNLSNAIKVLKPHTLFSTDLDPKYRLGYDPLYVAPSAKLISIMKRASLGFGVFGLYISHLMTGTPLFSMESSYLLAGLSVVPLPLVHYFTRDYVSRIFRVFNKEEPVQNLESLEKGESLIIEKLSFTGRSYYNYLVKVEDLKTVNKRFGWVNWSDKNGIDYYVVDSIGGLKMDRIWGNLERNSDVDNGRYVD